MSADGKPSDDALSLGRRINGWNHEALPAFAEVADLDSERPPEEFAEFVEFARLAFGKPPINSASSTISSGHYTQRAVFPTNSLIADWMEFGRSCVESADIFILASILPIYAACLARRVWFPWGPSRKYPNVYFMLVGKPGDRKSSIILLAELLARMVLQPNSFLPASFSPECLMDEYSEGERGCADKIWIRDDANALLTDWTKTVNGQRVATQFLELYDCKGMSESFRRNRSGESDEQSQRSVESTSTSLCFGATFQIAAFPGQAVRAGMARRFLYFLAEKHGRLIVRPSDLGQAQIDALATGVRRLLGLSGSMDFTAAASQMWSDYQHHNRSQMDVVDPLREAELSRLSSAPMQTLSIAMIFAACGWAKGTEAWTGLIDVEDLRQAIEFVTACLDAAAHLDSVAHRAEINQDAEILLSRIRHDFTSLEGFHFATRTQLTKRYCSNSARAGSWRPDDIYLRYIPALERRGDARLIDKTGKREIYAFRQEN